MTTPAQTYPTSPAGYRPAIKFEYPMLQLNMIGIGILILAYAGFGVLMAQGRGTPPYAVSLNVLEVVVLILMLPMTIVVHEIIHGITYQLLGYKVSYGFAPQLGAAYAAAFGQFQKRGHNMLAAAMPLVVLTTGCLPLLSAANGLIAMMAFLVLLVNTSGAVGDMYIIGRLLRMPYNTLLYDVSITAMLIFEPE